MEIYLTNQTSYNFAVSCSADTGQISKCPKSLSPNAEAHYHGKGGFLEGPSGTIALNTEAPWGRVKMTIRFDHPFGPERTTLTAAVLGGLTRLWATAEGSELQHHHAVGKVTIGAGN